MSGDDIKLCNFFVRIKNSSSRQECRRRNQTARYMRYTKLPQFDFESNVKWPVKTSYILQPRLRRIVTFNDEENIMRMAQTLRSELGVPPVQKNIPTTSELEKNVLTNNIKDKSPPPKQPTSSSRYPLPDIAKLPPNHWSSVPSRYLNQKPASAKQESNSREKSLENPSSPTPRLKLKPPDNIAKPRREGRSLNPQVPQLLKGRNVSIKTNLNSTNKMLVQSIVSKKSGRPSLRKDENTKKKKTAEIKKLELEISSKKQVSDMYRTVGNHGPSIIFVPHEDPKPAMPLPALVEKDSYIEPNITILSDINIESEPKLNKNDFLTTVYINNNTGLEADNFPKSRTCELGNMNPEPEKKDVPTEMNIDYINSFIQTIDISNSQTSKLCEMNVGTDPVPEKKDVPTEMNIQHIHNFAQTDDLLHPHNDICTTYFESLEIPNITLLKNSHETKEFELGPSHSVPDLHVPSINITSHNKSNKNQNKSRSASFIIGRATLTYTTQQKIDFHVVSNKDKTPSSLSPDPLRYPMNVLSIYERKNKDLTTPSKYNTQKKKHKVIKESTNEMKVINRYLIPDGSKLVKPSELIDTVNIKLENDEICEQFQRELKFIDSFFESLQYLEKCSLANNSIGEKNVENWITKSGFDINNPEYDVLLSKFENSTNIDDIETMASKSLCLLNLLIRDEQRRAKNLLFVLKMREDALKDFTKSQMLWLENKKRQDNIDITTLKKKQRGALLKLQHECGEMQRMRKALLSLSEKRKLALMKTKKNIELKMKSNVSADQILANKKKIKRCSSLERPAVPLKCFDLSSSGCEETAVSWPKSNLPQRDAGAGNSSGNGSSSGSPEKSIKVGDRTPSPFVDQATDTAEIYVTVDGSYLNILFHNLKLPEIFSRGKSYEVNEEALKSIVNSANSHSAAYQIDMVENFIDLVKNREQDVSSSPSTARSLVEEFDQYYKDLHQEDLKSPLEGYLAGEPTGVDREVIEMDKNHKDAASDSVPELNLYAETSGLNVAVNASSGRGNEIELTEEIRVQDEAEESAETPSDAGGTTMVSVQSGPEPAPAPASVGPPPPPAPAPAAAARTSRAALASALHAAAPDTNVIFLAKSKLPLLPSIENVIVSEETSIPPVMSSSDHSEAEELRRQQLAIEREIKALEQQQSQLLVVREIPDKPPPPYTPPTEVRAIKLPRRFHPDSELNRKIKYYVLEDGLPKNQDDAYDKFVSDFCQESVEKYKEVRSDKPWDSYNLLPQKPPLSSQQLVEKTSMEIRDVLSCNVIPAPAVFPAMGNRRSDHIDDILFAEWRRCEPEWTALQADEVLVKGHLFEGIFQHVLSHTIDVYKNTVLGVPTTGSVPENSSV